MELKIDLDKPPAQREHVSSAKFFGKYNATVWGFYNKYFADDKPLRDAIDAVADARALTEDRELLGEIKGLAAESGLPVNFVHGIQMLHVNKNGNPCASSASGMAVRGSTFVDECPPSTREPGAGRVAAVPLSSR